MGVVVMLVIVLVIVRVIVIMVVIVVMVVRVIVVVVVVVPRVVVGGLGEVQLGVGGQRLDAVDPVRGFGRPAHVQVERDPVPGRERRGVHPFAQRQVHHHLVHARGLAVLMHKLGDRFVVDVRGRVLNRDDLAAHAVGLHLTGRGVVRRRLLIAGDQDEAGEDERKGAVVHGAVRVMG